MKHRLRGSQYPGMISMSEPAVVEFRDVPKIERPRRLSACTRAHSRAFAFSSTSILFINSAADYRAGPGKHGLVRVQLRLGRRVVDRGLVGARPLPLR